jgi:hypothetical protein
MGKTEKYELRPKVSASCLSFASRIFNVIETYQLRPTGSAPSVSYRDGQTPLNRTGSEPATQRGTSHTPHE